MKRAIICRAGLALRANRVSVRVPLRLFVAALLTMASFAMPGCQTPSSEAEQAASTVPQASTPPRTMGEGAPSASEMEGSLGIAPAQPAGNAGDLRIELAAPTQNGSRPQAPSPPITANPSPFVDESTVIPTKDLHGYAFPGVNQLEAPKVAKVEPAPAAPVIDEEEIEKRANAKAEVLAQQKATLMAQGMAEERAAVLAEEMTAKRVAEIERNADARVQTLAEELASEKALVEELATEKATLMAQGMAEERADQLAREMTQQRIAELEKRASANNDALVEQLATEKAALMAQGMAKQQAESIANAMVAERMAEIEKSSDARVQALAEQLATQKAEQIAQQQAALIAEGLAEEKARAMAEAMAEERVQALAEELAQEKAKAMAAETARIEIEAAREEMMAAADAPVHQALPTPEASKSPVGLSDWQPAGDLVAVPPQGDYRIGAGDILEFQAFSDPTLNRELTVRYDGHISLPLIEDINVTGHTREEAEQQIQQAYKTVFKNPQMSLLVRETASKTFAVIGDIETPGVYPFLRPTTLIEAISLAGGLRRRNSSSSVGGFVGVTGQLTKAFVIRHHEGERMVFQFDLRQIGRAGAHAGDAPIYHGDLIYVPEGVNLIYLLGESRNPVIVELTEGMTLLQMLSLSGGFNQSTARLRNVVLMREVDGENTRVMNVNVREMLRTGKDLPLSPGDIIYIPQKWTVRLSEFVARFTGIISPVLDMYNSAVEAYYTADIARASLNQAGESRTLQRLIEIEQFGTSTSNIVDLFGAP